MKPNPEPCRLVSSSPPRGALRRRRGERGAALVIAILVLAILTVIGIALMLITSTESRIAANEWSVNRAFYASDAGIRWATVEMTNWSNFLPRPEYSGNPFGNVVFGLPSHKHASTGFFQGDPTETDIQVRVQAPSLVGSFPARGELHMEGAGKKKFFYAFEVRSTGGENVSSPAVPQYSKSLVSEVAVGPLPDGTF